VVLDETDQPLLVVGIGQQVQADAVRVAVSQPIVEALNIPNSPVFDNSRPALDLFPNPEQLQREMTAEITRVIMNQRK